MKLKRLLNNLTDYKIYGTDSIDVVSIADDSRKVERGGLFVAIKGMTADGHDFIPQVLEKGAGVIVGEKEPDRVRFKNATFVKVRSSRAALPVIAANWFGNPANKLKIIGVTGTKGKTSVCYLIYGLLAKAGIKTGLVSSVSAKVGNKEYDTGFHVTTPDALSLQELLSRMVKEGCEWVVLEVTSHGLDQERVGGINFDIGVLTNIALEHSDYHKSMENYVKTKLKLLQRSKVVVVNKDDRRFDKIAKQIPSSTPLITFALFKGADYKGEDIENDGKMSFNLRHKNKRMRLESTYLGEYNVLNVLAAIAAVRKVGLGFYEIKKCLPKVKTIPGRLEKIGNDKGIDIYIDFAHTPDSLKRVLKFLKKITKGRLICVFGAAGERDALKRPLMGEVSSRISDMTILTAEDPRSENVNSIIEQIAKGAKNVSGAKEIFLHNYHTTVRGSCVDHTYIKIPERGEAISFAIQKVAKKDDTVVICGKGHEKSMCYESVEYPWSDQEAVVVALNGKVKSIKRRHL